MSGSLQDALSGVIGDAAPSPSEGSFFHRVPDEVATDPRVSDAECRVLGAVLKWCRGGYQTDATDDQIGRLCGKSARTVQRLLRKLSLKGFVVRLGKTCMRVIRVMFRFRTASEPSPTHANPDASPAPTVPELTSQLAPTHDNSGANSRQLRRQLTSELTPSLKAKEQSSKARSSSSSPGGGDTPTTAKTEDPPRPFAPPPPVADESEYRTEARFEAMPEDERSRLRADVVAAHPELARFPSMVRAYCLAELSGRPEPEPSRADRDAALMSLLLDADDPAMRMASAATLCDSGRADLVVERIDFEVARRTGRQPVSGPPADPKSPCRPPG